MKALPVLATLVLAVAACGSEDPWPIHPPGGGGGTGGGGDDDGVDAGGPDGGGGGAVSGQVCVVTQFDAPFACANILASHNVLVEVVGGGSDVSDSAGNFSIATTTSPVTLQVGSEAGEGLMTTRFASAATSGAKAPAVDEMLWGDMLTALLENQDSGAGLVYVVDSTGAPVAGVDVSTTASAASRAYYDDGTGAFDPNATTTGADGILVVLDTLPFSATATLDTRVATAAVDAPNLGVGVAVITLPDS